MGTKNTITIAGVEYPVRVTALIPRQYRFKFGSDLIADMSRLQKSFEKAKKGDEVLDVFDLTVFENVAWIMLKAGGADVGESPDEWLDKIEGVFPIYEALPQIIELWGLNQMTTSTPRKKAE